VYGCLAERKRQIELIAFLNQLEKQISPSIRVIRVVLDNVRMHTGKQVFRQDPGQVPEGRTVFGAVTNGGIISDPLFVGAVLRTGPTITASLFMLDDGTIMNQLFSRVSLASGKDGAGLAK